MEDAITIQTGPITPCPTWKDLEAAIEEAESRPEMTVRVAAAKTLTRETSWEVIDDPSKLHSVTGPLGITLTWHSVTGPIGIILTWHSVTGPLGTTLTWHSVNGSIRHHPADLALCDRSTWHHPADSHRYTIVEIHASLLLI